MDKAIETLFDPGQSLPPVRMPIRMTHSSFGLRRLFLKRNRFQRYFIMLINWRLK